MALVTSASSFPTPSDALLASSNSSAPLRKAVSSGSGSVEAANRCCSAEQRIEAWGGATCEVS